MLYFLIDILLHVSDKFKKANMKRSEKLILHEITNASHNMKDALRGLTIGKSIAMIRKQLGMSQSVLARLAHVPQSTISRIESSSSQVKLTTLHKILEALSCELVLAPLLTEPIETIRRKQAHKLAEKNIRYLQGTMSLEKQAPDKLLIKELIKEEEEELLRSHGTKLWQD